MLFTIRRAQQKNRYASASESCSCELTNPPVCEANKRQKRQSGGWTMAVQHRSQQTCASAHTCGKATLATTVRLIGEKQTEPHLPAGLRETRTLLWMLKTREQRAAGAALATAAGGEQRAALSGSSPTERRSCCCEAETPQQGREQPPCRVPGRQGHAPGRENLCSAAAPRPLPLLPLPQPTPTLRAEGGQAAGRQPPSRPGTTRGSSQIYLRGSRPRGWG